MGHTYTSSGEDMDVKGGTITPSVFADANFANRSAERGVEICVAIKAGHFFDTPCTEVLPYLCEYDRGGE